MATFPDYRIDSAVVRLDGRHMRRVTAKLCPRCLASFGICANCGSTADERDHAIAFIRTLASSLPEKHVSETCRVQEHDDCLRIQLTATDALFGHIRRAITDNGGETPSESDLQDEVAKYREYGVPDDAIFTTLVRQHTGVRGLTMPVNA
jgi:hypothetical protein